MTNFKTLMAAACAAAILLQSCGYAARQAEENLQLLQRKAQALDSIINVETTKVSQLDSLVKREIGLTHNLDSLITRESKRIDSLVNKVYRTIDQRTK